MLEKHFTIATEKNQNCIKDSYTCPETHG